MADPRHGDSRSRPSAEDVRAIVAEVLAALRQAQGPAGGAQGPAGGAQGPAGGAQGPAGDAQGPKTPLVELVGTTAGRGLDKLGRGESLDRQGGATGPGADIDLPDPTRPEVRRIIGVDRPANPTGLENLVASTTARIGVGRAGPRPRTSSLLLFRADHAVTQDAIFGEVPAQLLDQFDMFTVQTQVTDADEYLLRPDLGRLLSAEGRAEVERRCTKNPQVQIVVGDGLSWAAVANNLPKIYPVIEQGLRSAGLTVGTPFFVRYCRVGVINDVNDIVGADVVVLLIGERPGLGVADALSVYSGWRPGSGKTDAHRDVICMITDHGGTNPLEAGAYVVSHVRTVLEHQASGVELRLRLSGGSGSGGA